LKYWRVKLDPLFEQNLRGISSQTAKTKLDMKIRDLRIDPCVGKQLPPYNHLWEIRIDKKYRLYYEIWEKQQVILLKAFYPRRLQKRYLRRRAKSILAPLT